MGSCPGCGGYARARSDEIIHSPPESWGHIIGCGGFNTPEPRHIPWGKKEVREILTQAFQMTKLPVENVDKFALNLQSVLGKLMLGKEGVVH